MNEAVNISRVILVPFLKSYLYFWALELDLKSCHRTTDMSIILQLKFILTLAVSAQWDFAQLIKLSTI